MQIFIKQVTGSRLTLEVGSSDTLDSVIAKIGRHTGLLADAIYLTFAGKKLERGRTLSDYHVQHKDTLHIVDNIITAGVDLRRGRFGLSPRRGASYLSTVPLPPDPRTLLKSACDKLAEALIIEFYQYENTTYKPACFPSIQGIANKGIEFSIPVDHGAPQFRWIHLPANNPAWVEMVLQDLLGERKAHGVGHGTQKMGSIDLLLRPISQATRHSVQKERPGLVQFVKPSYSRVSSREETVDPFFAPLEDERVNSSLFIPFIEQELRSSHEERKRTLDNITNPTGPVPQFLRLDDPIWTGLSHRAQILIAYGFDQCPVHERRTLDQAFYYTMPTKKAWERDETQVVSRFGTQPNGRCLLMVDQLWMWVIQTKRKRKDGSEYNLKTVVTAFPTGGKEPGVEPTSNRAKQTQNDGEAFDNINMAKAIPDARGRILSALYGNYNPPVVTPTDLICLIIDKCAGLFNPTPQEALGGGADYLDPFVVGIGECASTQTDLAEKLSQHSRELQTLLKERNRLLHRSFSELLSEAHGPGKLSDVDEKIDQEIQTLSDITEETECLEKIKDILDELNSISYFFAQQIAVVQTMAEDAALQHRVQGQPRGDNTTPVWPPKATAEAGPTAPKGAGDVPWKESESSSSLPTASSQMKTADNIIQDSFQDMEMKFSQLIKTLARRREAIGHLKAEALRVYKDLCDILDLKQKQATVSQALSARQESKEAEKQGQTILLFTIITIIFLPLSFIAAIFSMNATEITGDTVVRPISEIFSIMIPSTAGVLIISLLLAYTSSLKYSAAAILRLARLAWPSDVKLSSLWKGKGSDGAGV